MTKYLHELLFTYSANISLFFIAVSQKLRTPFSALNFRTNDKIKAYRSICMDERNYTITKFNHFQSFYSHLVVHGSFIKTLHFDNSIYYFISVQHIHKIINMEGQPNRISSFFLEGKELVSTPTSRHGANN